MQALGRGQALEEHAQEGTALRTIRNAVGVVIDDIPTPVNSSL